MPVQVRAKGPLRNTNTKSALLLLQVGLVDAVYRNQVRQRETVRRQEASEEGRAASPAARLRHLHANFEREVRRQVTAADPNPQRILAGLARYLSMADAARTGR